MCPAADLPRGAFGRNRFVRDAARYLEPSEEGTEGGAAPFERELDTKLDAPVFGSDSALDIVVASLPLAPGYKTTLRSFDILSQAVKVMSVEVVGVEKVTVPAGTFEAFKVELKNLDGEPGDCDAAEINVRVCMANVPNGYECDEDSDCANKLTTNAPSGHCQNGYCCTHGDCCNQEVNCPSSYTQGSICRDQYDPANPQPRDCQGDAGAARCDNATEGSSFSCFTEVVPDDLTKTSVCSKMGVTTSSNP